MEVNSVFTSPGGVVVDTKWTGRDEKKGKTQEKMERRSRKGSSSAGSEKMERVCGRLEKMEEHCSTGQSPPWAVVPMDEEEEEEEEEEDDDDDDDDSRNL